MRPLSRRSLARPERYVVLLRPQVSLDLATEALQRCGAEVLWTLPLVHGLICTCPGPASLAALAGHPAVHVVEADLRWSRRRALPGGDLAEAGSQALPWGLERIGAPRAWQRSLGQGVPVAVIDTGADWTHPDLAPRVQGGINVLAPEEPPDDDNGHGTHVAGIVAATDNRFGVVGVAPAADLYVVKAFDRRGTGTVVDLLLALQWCADHGMRVVNMSFGQQGSSPALARAVAALDTRGVVLVAAAGNGGPRRPVDFPARYPQVLAVTALSPRDTLLRSSSRGPEVDLAAPGYGVLSLWPGSRLRALSGTSMAAAHVAGAAALVLAAEPELTPAAVRDRLRATAQPLPHLGPEEQGAGLVRADRAVHARPEPA